MALQVPEGHLGHLTEEQDLKLKDTWRRLHSICGIEQPGSSANVPNPGAIASTTNGAMTNPNDKYGQTAEYRAWLSNTPTADIRRAVWGMIRTEHPDSIVLRFLRARKWEVEQAVVMLVSTAKWRVDARVDETVVRNGEGVALKPASERTDDDEGFLQQWRSGKSYVRGIDRLGRVVYIVKVSLHDPRAQSAAAMERFVLHTVESIRALVKDPFDTALLIFDLTGFGLRNMDFACVKFIVQVFEARYPETLGMVLVNNAPYIFQGVWKVVRGWLDPVVAAKIRFTRSADDFAEFIDKSSLQKEFGGDDEWEYYYLEPVAGENDKLTKQDMRAQLQRHRDDCILAFEQATRDWIQLGGNSSPTESGKILTRRETAARSLIASYWELDPYIRARNYYDRAGVLDKNGKVNFAPVA